MSKKLRVRAVCARYGGNSTRTIDRWTAEGILPKPEYINGIRYWDEDLLDQHDEARQAATEAA
jgi:hypothetical protein